MTRENAKKLLPIITAYAEGKAIEYHSFDNGTGNWKWIDIAEEGCIAEFSADPERYRIKIVPRELFRIVYCTGALSTHSWSTLGEARNYAAEHYPDYLQIVRYVETPLT